MADEQRAKKYQIVSNIEIVRLIRASGPDAATSCRGQ